MRKRSPFANIALACFLVSFLLTVIAFTTSSWLTSDKGARHNTRGLWTHCFSWQADSKSLYDRRFFVGCQDEIRGFSVPAYNRRVMIATQVFFTLCFASAVVGAILSSLYFFRCDRGHKRFVPMLKTQCWNVLTGAICGTIAILVFVTQRDLYVWMPFDGDVYFGWSLYVGVVGVVAMFVSSAFFFRDLRMHKQPDSQQPSYDVSTPTA